MSKFLTQLEASLLDDDVVWELDSPLVYESDFLKETITVPKGFQTDFASVPRFIPIASNTLLDKSHRESVIHDYLYRDDSLPLVTQKEADEVFFEAMTVRGKSKWVRYSMWAGVRIGGFTSYHKKLTGDKL
jgi:hypothetical protein